MVSKVIYVCMYITVYFKCSIFRVTIRNVLFILGPCEQYTKLMFMYAYVRVVE